MPESENAGAVVKKTKSRGWTVFRSLLFFFFTLDLLVIVVLLFIYYQHYKTIEVIVSGVWVALTTFFGYIKLKHGRGMTLPTLFGQLPVVMCTVAYTIIIGFFFIYAVFPVQKVTITTYREGNPIGGADVYWQGEYKTKTDSVLGRLVIYGVRTGSYNVEYRLQGYKPDTTTANVAIITPTSVSHNFRIEDRLYGSLYVKSNPRDAEIWIDGSYTGQKTPDTIPGLSEGRHMLVVVKTGYLSDSQAINVKAEQVITKDDITLTRKPVVYGSIHLTSQPTGAEMCLDGTWRMGKTPTTIVGVTEGEHVLELKKNISVKEAWWWKDKIDVIAHKTTSIHKILEKTNLHAIEIRSEPSGVDVYVDEHRAAEGKTNETIMLTEGRHSIILKKDGYKSMAVLVDASRDRVTTTYVMVED